jgi:hypothetical protein
MQVAGGSITSGASARGAGGEGVGLTRKQSEERGLSSAPLGVAAGPSAIPVPKFVCILGIARTGTNHLGMILHEVPEIDSRRELFHPVRCWSIRPEELREFARRSGEAFPCLCEDSQTIRAVRRRPGLVLDCMADMMAADKRVICFKVFRDQLSARQVRTAIISRPDTIIIFIRRRPIDAYVSQRKACQIHKWTRIDTTQIKVDIDAGRYVRWWRETSKWYRQLEAACWSMNKPFYELSYEDDIDRDPIEVARRFCAVVEQGGLAPFTLSQGNPIVGLTRQDQNRDVSDRVGNWAEFHTAMVARRALDKAFAPIPHYQPTWWDKLWHQLRG